MRYLISLLFLFLSIGPVFADEAPFLQGLEGTLRGGTQQTIPAPLESQFLKQTAEIAKIEPESATAIPGGLILENCAVDAPGLGAGKFGKITILNESQDKIGELKIENLKTTKLSIGYLKLTNVEGYAGLMAASSLATLNLSRKMNAKQKAELLRAAKAVSKAMKGYKAEAIEIIGYVARQDDITLKIDRLMSRDIGLNYAGESRINDISAMAQATVVATIDEIGFNRIQFPEIDSLLELNGDEDAEDIYGAFNNTRVDGFYIKKASVPLFSVNLREATANLDFRGDKAQGSFALSGLSAPGLLLQFIGAEEAPETISANAEFNFRAEENNGKLVSLQNFSVASPQLFDLSAQGALTIMDDEEPVVTDAMLEFVNNGVLEMLPPTAMAELMGAAAQTSPALGQLAKAFLSGKVSTLRVTLEDSRRIDDMRIETK